MPDVSQMFADVLPATGELLMFGVFTVVSLAVLKSGLQILMKVLAVALLLGLLGVIPMAVVEQGFIQGVAWVAELFWQAWQVFSASV